jgi:hypothetical protein
VDRLRLALPRQDQADPLHMLHDWWVFSSTLTTRMLSYGFFTIALEHAYRP